MKCIECTKLEAVATYPEKVASWIARHLFADSLKDEVNAAYLRGFEQGYKLGREHQREFNAKIL